MANLDLDIKNLPDDTYEVYLRRNSDKAEQFNSALAFTAGLATAALATAVDGEYIEGALFGNNDPAIRGAVIGGYAYAVTRYFVNLDSTANAHYTLGTPIVLAGDLTIDYVSSATGTAMELAEGFEINSSGDFVAPASVTDIELNGASIGTSGAAALDGKLNTVKFIGAISESVGDIGVGFDGIIANVLINNAGTTTTFKLDQETANTEYSLENSFGDELAGGGTVSAGSGWTDNGDGSYDWDGIANGTTLEFAVGLVSANENLRLQFTVTNYTGSGDFGLSSTTTSSFAQSKVSGNGSVDMAFEMDSTVTNRVRFFAREGQTLTVRVTSLKEIQGNSVAYQNIAQDERELFTLQDDGSWLGGEALIGGDFSDDSAWVLGANMSIINGEVIGAELTSPFNSELKQIEVMSLGQMYLISFEGLLTSGTYGMQNGAFQVIPELTLSTTTSKVSYRYIADTTAFACKRGTDVDALILDNASVKRVIEAA